MRCAPAHQTRTQTVFGVGRRDADLLVIGEAPGADEDRQGEPFVGRAGQLLNAMLQAIGLPRGDVYIANILKCRPPNNRDPQPPEATACTPYLSQQIDCYGRAPFSRSAGSPRSGYCSRMPPSVGCVDEFSSTAKRVRR